MTQTPQPPEANEPTPPTSEPGPAAQWPQAPQPMPGYPAVAPNHPQTTTVLVLGILGLVLCQIVGPFAWVIGNRVVREIDASGGRLGGRESANIGRILGIIATALLAFSLVVVIGFLLLGGIAATTSTR